MIQQLYHVGQHGDADNSFTPNWSPSGLPVDARRRRQPRPHRGGDRRVASAPSPAPRCGRDGRASTASSCSPPTTPSSTSSGRRGRTVAPTGGAARWRTACASRRALLDAVRRACGDDFIVGLAVNLDPDSDGSLSVAELQEIVAWHDERALMDYVTCGTGSYFDFSHLMPTSLFPQRLGEPFAAALKEVVTHAAVQAESHIRTPAARRGGPRRRTRRHGVDRPRSDRRPPPRRQGPPRPARARCARASRATSCAGAGGRRDYWISCLVNPSVGRERAVGWRPLRAGAGTAAGARRRRRTGRARGGAGRRRARPRRDAPRGGRRARRPVAPGRAPAEPQPDHRPPRLVRVGARPAWRRRAARLAVGPGGGRRAGADDVVVATGAEPARTRRSSAACASPTVSRASTATASPPSRTCSPAPCPRPGECCSSTTSATGGASARRCSCRSPAAQSRSSRRRRPSPPDCSTAPRTPRPAGASPEPVVASSRTRPSPAWTGDGVELRSTLTGRRRSGRSTGSLPPRRRSRRTALAGVAGRRRASPTSPSATVSPRAAPAWRSTKVAVSPLGL